MRQLILPLNLKETANVVHFPIVPSWWPNGSKFMHLKKPFTAPAHVVGYDTETYRGSILTQQIVSKGVQEIQWCDDDDVLDRFLRFIERNYEGYIIIYCFNAEFDLAILLRKYITNFLKDDFAVQHKGWELGVFCSKNWYATFKKPGWFVRFLDIHNYFTGNLASVAKSFNLEIGKLERPEGLGAIKYTKADKKFVEYAMQDARLCYQMGERIVEMHQEFDIPLSTSSANFAEKVFRRKFVQPGWQIQYPPFQAQRLAEITYHGGKNGYYLPGPRYVHNVYEYDFNAAYGFAMYSLPSFLSGRYRKVKTFKEGKAGVYQVTGKLRGCPFGILYNAHFDYFRYPDTQIIKAYVTSYELEEAIKSGEFTLDTCKGWVWESDTEENPIHEYAKYFWEKKNEARKGDVRYLFYKLCLNSLYGKWIQRNPKNHGGFLIRDGQVEYSPRTDISGGLYHPFIATLITGFTRARLHSAEHFFDAIESSTDSVKSKRFVKANASIKSFGAMQLEKHKCAECQREDIKSVQGVFLRNRLNLLLDKKGHILKCALHGFWGRPDLLKKLWLERRTSYELERMPKVREALTQQGKPMFDTFVQERFLNIDWSRYAEIK